MKNITFLLTFILLSCSTSNENMSVIRGIPEKQFKVTQKKLLGRKIDQTRKILGTPVMEGEFGGGYRMIYPIKDMKRFYIEITYNTDVNLDCVVIDFFKPKNQKLYVFPRNGKIKKLLRCNQKEGAILKLQEALDK